MKTYLPLDVIKSFNIKYPKIWDIYESHRKDKSAKVSSLMVGRHFHHQQDPYPSMQLANNIILIAEWRRSKDVLTFPAEFWIKAKNQPKKDVFLSVSSLDWMTDEVFYIDFERFLPKVHGFFIGMFPGRRLHLEVMMNTKSYSTVSFNLNKDCTLEELLKDIEIDYESQKVMTISKDAFFTVIEYAFHALLYMCNEIVDISASPEQKKTYKKPSENSKIRDIYSEVKKWEIAKKLSKKILGNPLYSIEFAHWDNSDGNRVFVPSRLVEI